MMTLNPEILSVAEAARERMLERQAELEHARADLNHQIRRLHAAGGSMREISDKLGVSHQRVHQIVANGEDVSDPLLRRLGRGLQQSLGGKFTRFTESARTVVTLSLEDAGKRGASVVEPEHLLLALASPEAGPSARVLTAAGATLDTLRVALEHTHPSGQQDKTRKARASFSAESRRALELSLQEALHRGDTYIGSQHLLLGVLRGDHGRVQALLDTVDVTPDAIRDAVDAL